MTEIEQLRAQLKAAQEKAAAEANNALALAAQVQKQKEENDKLLKAAQSSVRVVGNPDTGTVSVYGLGRFPISPYPEQWEKIFGLKEAIMAECKRPDVLAAAARTKAEKKANAAKAKATGQNPAQS